MFVKKPQLEGSERVLQLARVASTVTSPPGSNTSDLELWRNDREFVMSFARGLSIIHSFANQTTPIKLADISRKTKIPASAVRRLLHTLAELGYVEQIDSKYVLNPATLLLGHSFLSSSPLAIRGAPIVSRLSNELGIFCALSVQVGDDAMLACVSSLQAHTGQDMSHLHIGSRAPLYAGAGGQLFLSAMSETELEAYFARVVLRPFTHLTPTDVTLLRQIVPTVGTQGYAIADRTLTPDHRSIAVPVLDGKSRMIAALVVMTSPEYKSINELVSSALPKLKVAARDLGSRLA